MYQYNKTYKDYARENRNSPTKSEQKIWQILRKRQVRGRKFVRQFPKSHFIFDFFCVEEQLAIEIDGSIHSLEKIQLRDEEKNSYCQRHGIKLIRFTDEEVLGLNLDTIVGRIEGEFENSPKTNTP